MRDVLIVEEDIELAVELADGVEGRFRVRTALSGMQALRSMDAHPTDAVLLDLDMSDAAAFTVLARTTAMRPAPRVVVLASPDRLSSVVKAMRLGASDCLSKPCTPWQLIDALNGAASPAAVEHG